MSYYFPYKTMWRSFFSAMAAAVTLKVSIAPPGLTRQWINPFRTFKLVLFQVTYSANWHGFEMIFFLLLGVLGVSLAKRNANLQGDPGVDFHPLQCQIDGLPPKLMGQPLPDPAGHRARLDHGSHQLSQHLHEVGAQDASKLTSRFDAADLLSTLFKECDGVSDGPFCNVENELNIVLELAVAGACKFILAILTFGLEIPGGFYMPSMMVGACFGRVLGILVSMWQR